MDLKTFVTETLTQIAAGIKDAQRQQKELGALFSPEYTSVKDKSVRKKEYSTDALDMLEIVEFDVALMVADKVSGGAKAGLEVIGISLAGAKGEIARQNETISRVKFDITVRWPRCDGPLLDSTKN